jgi:hypothetical protein
LRHSCSNSTFPSLAEQQLAQAAPHKIHYQLLPGQLQARAVSAQGTWQGLQPCGSSSPAAVVVRVPHQEGSGLQWQQLWQQGQIVALRSRVVTRTLLLLVLVLGVGVGVRVGVRVRVRVRVRGLQL